MARTIVFFLFYFISISVISRSMHYKRFFFPKIGVPSEFKEIYTYILFIWNQLTYFNDALFYDTRGCVGGITTEEW